MTCGEVDQRIDATGEPPPVPVFFLSDSTGISAETMGNALLIQFPERRFERRLIPFHLLSRGGPTGGGDLGRCSRRPGDTFGLLHHRARRGPTELLRTRCPLIDFFGMHMELVESILGARDASGGAVARDGGRQALQRADGWVEYAIEHDDGQSMRALDKADVILVAPSRCGKTPTTMYLALQHGIFVANYPLVDEDFERRAATASAWLRDRCFGLTTTPARLSQVRHEKAQLPLCLAGTVFLRAAPGRAMYRNHRLPVINSSTKSVEEMSTVILQALNPRL